LSYYSTAAVVRGTELSVCSAPLTARHVMSAVIQNGCPHIQSLSGGQRHRLLRVLASRTQVTLPAVACARHDSGLLGRFDALSRQSYIHRPSSTVCEKSCEKGERAHPRITAAVVSRLARRLDWLSSNWSVSSTISSEMISSMISVHVPSIYQLP